MAVSFSTVQTKSAGFGHWNAICDKDFFKNVEACCSWKWILYDCSECVYSCICIELTHCIFMHWSQLTVDYFMITVQVSEVYINCININQSSCMFSDETVIVMLNKVFQITV